MLTPKFTGYRKKEVIMMELPIAECMKEHYKKNNATFTDSERATLFWQSHLPLSERLAALREILDATEDKELKEQIQKRLDAEAEEEKAFMLRDSDYVHMVFLDDAKNAESVFVSVDAAIAYGKENCDETFKINKEILEDRLDDDADAEQGLLLGGEAEFKKDGTLLSCRCWGLKEPDVVFINDIEPEGFEEAYIPVLNPFEYGDIVHIIGDDRPAVVVTSKEQWNESLERIAKSGIMRLNYYTNALTVEFLCSDGEFSHGHPNILHLEKVEHWEDEDEWNLLTAVSELMKGNGWAEPVFAFYQTNKHKDERGWSDIWAKKS